MTVSQQLKRGLVDGFRLERCEELPDHYQIFDSAGDLWATQRPPAVIHTLAKLRKAHRLGAGVETK